MTQTVMLIPVAMHSAAPPVSYVLQSLPVAHSAQAVLAYQPHPQQQYQQPPPQPQYCYGGDARWVVSAQQCVLQQQQQQQQQHLHHPQLQQQQQQQQQTLRVQLGQCSSLVSGPSPLRGSVCSDSDSRGHPSNSSAASGGRSFANQSLSSGTEHSSFDVDAHDGSSAGGKPKPAKAALPPQGKQAARMINAPKIPFGRSLDDRPCGHNSWDNVRVARERMTMRCRVCQRQWRANVSLISQHSCSTFLKNAECGVFSCPAGEECSQLHIHYRKQGLKERLQDHGTNILKFVQQRDKPDVAAVLAKPPAPPTANDAPHIRRAAEHKPKPDARPDSLTDDDLHFLQAGILRFLGETQNGDDAAPHLSGAQA
ncbi:hypothetical protein DIPPA_17190 [Diplonema papillatum]|nr:hypothetical protein DIPPA_17190 [Diplonema papillatum]